MIIQINSQKIIQIFDETLNTDLTLFGWDWDIKYYFFGTIPVIIYTKPLIK